MKELLESHGIETKAINNKLYADNVEGNDSFVSHEWIRVDTMTMKELLAWMGY